MSKPDGGPAFPGDPGPAGSSLVMSYQRGMSMRDYFAAAALQGIFSAPAMLDAIPAALSASVYRIADAMLAERAK